MAASQTANIMSFQNSSGTELSYVDKDGNAYFNGIKMGTYGGEKGFEITTQNAEIRETEREREEEQEKCIKEKEEEKSKDKENTQ